MADIAALLRDAEQRLQTISDSARLDSEVLLAFVLKRERSYLLAFPERIPSDTEQQQYQQLLDRRASGEPVAHIIGRREFWSLDLIVNADTLIPRPDTEVLVEFVLERFDQSPLKLADLGTGTGGIALALASERPLWTITATDQSEKALAIARQNAQNLGLKTVQFMAGHWFDALPDNDYDVIVSNPPYICDNDPHLQQGDVRFEPMSALASGADGLDDIRLLISQAPDYLKNGGWLVLEHGYDQPQAVTDLFKDHGYQHIEQRRDYGGNPRVTAAQKIA